MKLCKCGCGNSVKSGNEFVHGHNRSGLPSYTSGNRWSMKHDKCIDCGSTELPHAGRGMCRKCYKKFLVEKKRVVWSKNFSACRSCGKTKRPHKAKGFCTRCYNRNLDRARGKKKRNFGSWSWYYDKCKSCGTTEVKHVKDGLCYNCYEQSKRDLKDCTPCPVCGVMAKKLNQHLTMKSKRCKEHHNYQYSLYKKYFDSDLSLDDITNEIGNTERHSVSKQFVRFFGKEKTAERNEAVRRCNISEKAVINYNSKNRFGTVVEYESPEQGLIKLRSKLEAEYAEFLDSGEVSWLYECKSFPYLDREGKRRTYTPDFYLPDENKFIEIKGFEKDLDQYKVDVLRSQGVNIEIITQEELKDIVK